MDRLFVPLNSGPFEDFKEGSQTYELRGYGRQYTEKHVFSGRKVELRKGYSGESIWGTIGDIKIGSLEIIINKIGYKCIIPRAQSRLEAKERINEILGIHDKYLAFEVLK